MSNKEMRKLVDLNNEACCDYELGNLCKEWSVSQGYIIASGLTHRLNGWYEILDDPQGECITDGSADTELDAILKAIEWVMENIKNGGGSNE